MRLICVMAAGACLLFYSSPKSFAGACTGRGVEVQILGSGGPELTAQRASSSYLIWQDHAPVALIDSGGGSALNLANSGARVEQLDAIFFTHLHVDHSADFPALIKSTYFQSRMRSLPVYGPTGNDSFPSTTEFVADLFGPRGAYRYLASFLTGGEGGYELQAHDVKPSAHQIKTVYVSQRFSASAATVIHGHVPALGWRFSLGGREIAFSGDTSGTNGNLEKLADNVDLLVAHNAVPEGSAGTLLQLHMAPSTIGRIARDAHVKNLVLSHRMERTLGQEQETLSAIAENFKGPVAFAEDGECF